MSSEEKSPDGPGGKSKWGSTEELIKKTRAAEWHFKEWQHENEKTEKRLQDQIHKIKSILAVLRKKLLTRQDDILDILELNHMTLHEKIEKNTQNLENINVILQKKLLTHSQLGGRKTRKRKTKKKRKKKRKRRKKRKTKRRR